MKNLGWVNILIGFGLIGVGIADSDVASGGAVVRQVLPDTPARLWLIAPGPHEAWTMRIDNEGPRPIRIPADVRLLTFEIEVQSSDPNEVNIAIGLPSQSKKKKQDIPAAYTKAETTPLQVTVPEGGGALNLAVETGGKK